MSRARAEATIDDLYKVEGKAEIVNGELVLMSPTGSSSGRAGGVIYRSLLEYEEETGRGFAYPDNVGFVVELPTRKSFSPDAAFYVGEPGGATFLKGAPLLAAEVRSEEDYGAAAEKRLAAKRADYFAAGTQVVWDVDVIREGWVRSHSAERPDEPRVCHRGDTADAEPVLPGWCLPVDDILRGSRRRG